VTSWRTINGRLPSIEFAGDASSRFPVSLAEQVINDLSRPGDTVLDPFAGFGTTFVVGAKLGRRVVGFEPDAARFMYARGQVGPDALLIHDLAENIARYEVPPVDLVVCSPPFDSLSGYSALADTNLYLDVLISILLQVAEVVCPNAPIAVEMVNRRFKGGQVLPLAFLFATRFATIRQFYGETVFCNNDGTEIVPTFAHSYVMVFRNTRPTCSLTAPWIHEGQ